VKVMIVGATGSVGRHAVTYALEVGHDVTALAREPARVATRHERLVVVEGDVLDPDSLRNAVAGSEAVVSCLGTKNPLDATTRSHGTRNIIDAMNAERVRRLVVMSAVGAHDSRAEARRYSFVFGGLIMPTLLRRSFGDMTKMEEAVRAGGTEWVIVRPVELADEPGEGPARVGLDGIPAGKAVPKARVAEFMVEQLVHDDYLGKAPSLYG
jgi:uncharacterized protein YbjT (DUF2867 family)